MVYSYQTESWLIEVTSKCNGKEHPNNRNMPFTHPPIKATSTSITLPSRHLQFRQEQTTPYLPILRHMVIYLPPPTASAAGSS
jgi:hypothetical protein